jgi:hypothetical protein
LVNTGDEAAREVMSGDVLVVPVDGGDVYEVRKISARSNSRSMGSCTSWSGE